MRNLSFVNDSFYHIYNRGVDKRRIFTRQGEYIRFIRTLSKLLNNGTAQETIVTRNNLAFKNRLDFVAYCLMPNHYHFLIKQLDENGITHFMHSLNTSYTKYFNMSHKRTGRLFEYTFRAVEITTDEQLIHVSRYIHLNPLIAHLTNSLERYKWSSYPDYINKRNGKLCSKDVILSYFERDYEKYKEFVSDQVDYARTLAEVKKQVIE